MSSSPPPRLPHPLAIALAMTSSCIQLYPLNRLALSTTSTLITVEHGSVRRGFHYSLCGYHFVNCAVKVAELRSNLQMRANASDS